MLPKEEKSHKVILIMPRVGGTVGALKGTLYLVFASCLTLFLQLTHSFLENFGHTSKRKRKYRAV